jgi:hypothetical protein
MTKAIGSMLIGTVFERGGETYILRAKTGATCQAFRESDDKLVAFDATAMGNTRHVPDVCLWAPSKAVGAS